ncbi:hypothetical protein [Haloarcula nitratireducens]|uniref:Uncharacterized protein n=1 Tax=Haloarcula nitratireducens TaxID=2487749 RepID=A0AAW4PBU5_9EURY|nr:hypothetical protein [Halomicroarcula nitratireducens]MBX0295181.1 hypothetical protein [Halomicroarcula nitratireducens]
MSGDSDDARGGDPITLGDGKTPVPCFDPYCCEHATVPCFDTNVRREVAFCSAHVEEWAANDHIVRSSER